MKKFSNSSNFLCFIKKLTISLIEKNNYFEKNTLNFFNFELHIPFNHKSIKNPKKISCINSNNSIL